MVMSEGTVVSGGERDRKLITWDSTRDWDRRTEVKLPDGVGSVRSLSKQKVEQVPLSHSWLFHFVFDKCSFQGEKDTALYIGTTRNCILEGAARKKTLKIAVWGHSNKLEAIASHPDDLAFVTAGYDKVVAKWRKQKVSTKMHIFYLALIICFHT